SPHRTPWPNPGGTPATTSYYMSRTRTLASIALAALGAGLSMQGLSAQGFSLDKTGGGVGGSVGFHPQGPPKPLYPTLFPVNEQQTALPLLGVTLDIPDAFAGPAMGVPGFFTNLSTSGAGSASLGVPNDPGFAGLRVPFQAIALPNSPPNVVSNLVRITVQ